MNKKKTSISSRKIIRRLVGFIKPYKKYFIFGLILTLFNALLNPARPFIVQYVLDNPVVEQDLLQLRIWIVVLISMLFLQGLTLYAQLWTTNLLGQSIINDLRHKVFSHILKLKMTYFDTTPIGTIQTRAISDIQTLNNIFTEGFISIFGELLQLFTILVLMFYTDWQLTLVVLSALPFILLATYLFKRAVTVAFKKVRNYVSELNAFLQEHITGMQVIQAYHKEEREAAKFDVLNKKHCKAHMDTIWYYSIFFPVIELITAFALALLVWYGSIRIAVDIKHEVTFGVLVAFLLYIQMFFRPIRMLADQFNSLQLGIVSGERIFSLLDKKDFITRDQNEKFEISNIENGIEIQFNHVQFEYKENEPVLKDLSFNVKPYSITAIVGATGAGKSSIINVLMRFYEIQSGSILVNKVELSKYNIETLRCITGLVLQDSFLFNGSIYENVVLGNHSISLNEVKNAAEIIGIDQFINQLPGNYEYNVGERGTKLSTGQRQLLSFLRVMIHKPQLLLLDEATSNIDSSTEYLIQQAINNTLNNRTSIIIAHRLSTIQKADQIIVMYKGKAVEIGSHQELLALDGYYKKLYTLQYGALNTKVG